MYTKIISFHVIHTRVKSPFTYVHPFLKLAGLKILWQYFLYKHVQGTMYNFAFFTFIFFFLKSYAKAPTVNKE